jgi:hypothetical protein
VFKKKPKDDLDNKGNSTGFGNNISRKQITINVYNILIKVLVK